jgi:DNA invertase Pin-like site-specific DNA recombinase
VDEAPAYSNAVRIGYARVSGRSQDHQLQLDALAGAGCREVVVETASTRGERPKLRATLNTLKAGDTLVIYKPDRVARSMKELLVLLEDDLHAKDINLHILTGICAGVHRPNAASIADKMLFMVASMAAEIARDYIREKTLEGQQAAAAKGNHGGRPKVIDPDMVVFARALRDQGTPMPDIAQKLKIQSGKNAGNILRSHPSTGHWPKPTHNTSPHAARNQLPPYSRSAHGGYRGVPLRAAGSRSACHCPGPRPRRGRIWPATAPRGARTAP